MNFFQSIIKWCTLFGFITQVLYPYYAFSQPSYIEQEGRLFARYEIGFTQNQDLPPLLIPVTKEKDTGIVSFQHEGAYQNGFIVNDHYCFEANGVKWALTLTGDLVAVEQKQTELDQLWVNNQSGKVVFNTDMHVTTLGVSAKEVEQVKALNVSTLSLSLGTDGNYVNKGELTLSQLLFLNDTKKKHGATFTNNGRMLMTGQAKVSGKGSVYNFNDFRYVNTQSLNTQQDILFENVSFFNKGNFDLAGKATLAFRNTFYNDAFMAFQEDVTLKGEFSLENEAQINPQDLNEVMTASQAQPQPLKGVFMKADLLFQERITLKNSGTFVIVGKSQGQLETLHNAGYFASQSAASHITLNTLTNTYAGIMKLEGHMQTTSFQNEGKMAALQLTLETQQFQNVAKGHLEIDDFMIKASNLSQNHGEIKSHSLTLQMPEFTNTGTLTTDRWHHIGDKFSNAPEAEVNVSTLSDLQLISIENKGDMQLGLLQGRLKTLRNENIFESNFSKTQQQLNEIIIENILNGGSIQIGGHLKANNIASLAGFEKKVKKTRVEQLHLLGGVDIILLEDVEVIKTLSGSVKTLSLYGTVLTASSDLTIEGHLLNNGTFQSKAGNISAKTLFVTGHFTALNGVLAAENIISTKDKPEGKTVVDTLTLVKSDSNLLNNVTIQQHLSGSVKTLKLYGTVLTESSDLTIEGDLINNGTFQSNAGNIAAKIFAVTGHFTALNGVITAEHIMDNPKKPEGKTIVDTLALVQSDSSVLKNVTIQQHLSGSVKTLSLFGTVLTASSDLTIEGDLINNGTFQSNAGNITAKTFSVTGHFTALNGVMTAEKVWGIADEPEGQTVVDILTLVNSDSSILKNVTIQKKLSGSVKKLTLAGTVLLQGNNVLFEAETISVLGTFAFQKGKIKTNSLTLGQGASVYAPNAAIGYAKGTNVAIENGLLQSTSINNSGELFVSDDLLLSMTNQVFELGKISTQGAVRAEMRQNSFFLLKQCEKNIKTQHIFLSATIFESEGPLTLHSTLNATLSGNFFNKHLFKVGTFHLTADTFQNGQSNATMGEIQVFGNADITTQKSIDNRFGKIRIKNDGKLSAKSGLYNGNAKQGPKLDLSRDANGNNLIFGSEFNNPGVYSQIRNGAMITTGGRLNVHCQNGSIDNDFGIVYSAQELRLKALLDITNKTGQILAGRDMFFTAQHLKNLADLKTAFFEKTIRVVAKSGNNRLASIKEYPIIRSYLESEGGKIKAINGDIHFNISNRITNEASSIFSNKNIYIDNVKVNEIRNGRNYISQHTKLISVSINEDYKNSGDFIYLANTLNRSYRAITEQDVGYMIGDSFRSEKGYPDQDRFNHDQIIRTHPAIIMAGQAVSMDLGDVLLSGTLSAPNITIKADVLKVLGDHIRPTQIADTYVVDIGSIALQTLNPQTLFGITPQGIRELSMLPSAMHEAEPGKGSEQSSASTLALQALTPQTLTPEQAQKYPAIRIIETAPLKGQAHRQNLSQPVGLAPSSLTKSGQSRTTYYLPVDTNDTQRDLPFPAFTFNPDQCFSTDPRASSHMFLSPMALNHVMMDITAKIFSRLNINGLAGTALINKLHANGLAVESAFKNLDTKLLTSSSEAVQKQILALSDAGMLYYTPVVLEYVKIDGEVSQTLVQLPQLVITKEMYVQVAKPQERANAIIANQVDIDVNTLGLDNVDIQAYKGETEATLDINVNKTMQASNFSIQSDGTTKIHVKEDATLQTGKNVTQVNHSSLESIKKTSEIYGKQGVHLHVEGDQTLGHIKIESQEKIENKVGGDSIKAPERVDNKQVFYGYKSTTTIQDITHHGAQFIVEDDNGKRGSCVEEIGGNANWANVSYRVGDLDVRCEKDFTLDALNDEHHYSYHYLDKGWCSRDEVTRTEGYIKSKGNIFDMETMRIVANGDYAYLKQVDIQGKLADITAKLVYFAQGTSIEYSSYSETSSDLVWVSSDGQSNAATTHVACKTNCPVRVNADKIIMEFVTEFCSKQKQNKNEFSFTKSFDDTAMKAFLEKVIVDDNTQFLTVNLQNVQELSECSVSTFGPLALGVIALAAAIATAGAASYLGGYAAGASGMTIGVPGAAAATSSGALFCETAAFAGAQSAIGAGSTVVALTNAGYMMTAGVTAGVTTLAAKVAVNLAVAKGDVGEALRLTATKDTLVSMVCSMASASVLQGVGTYNNIPITNTAASKIANQTIKAEKITTTIGKVLTRASQHAKTAALSAMVYATVAIVAGADVRDTMRDGALNSVGTMVANTFSEHFGICNQPELTHYVAKALVAAGTTALVAENKDKAAAAITAAGASVLNELMINSVAPVEETAIATHNVEIAYQEGTPLAATDKDRFSAMQAVNNFSQLANRCISGLAGFQGRSQQAFELGASIPAMTHAKAVEERVDQLREIRAQTLQDQLQGDVNYLCEADLWQDILNECDEKAFEASAAFEDVLLQAGFSEEDAQAAYELGYLLNDLEEINQDSSQTKAEGDLKPSAEDTNNLLNDLTSLAISDPYERDETVQTSLDDFTHHTAQLLLIQEEMENPHLTEQAKELLSVIKDVVIDLKDDVRKNWKSYGVAVAECMPAGVGTLTTLGHQGYDIYQGEQTVGGAAGTFVVEGTIGLVGGKLIKGAGKVSAHVYAKIAARLAERRAGKLGKQLAFASTDATRSIKALDLASDTGIKKIHGNSRHYVGDTHVYVIRDANGKLYKVGESTQGVNKFGQSKRAQQQVKKLRKETNENFKSEIRAQFPNKAEARQWETGTIERYRKLFGTDKLPGNKGNR